MSVPHIKIGNSRFGGGEIHKFGFRLTVCDILVTSKRKCPTEYWMYKAEAK